MPRRKPHTTAGPRERTTPASLSRELKVMAATSLGFMGGVQYLNKVAKSHPAAYMAFLAKVLVVKDDNEEVGNRTYVVRTINVIAQPTPGVINSPVAGHIAAPRLVANGGEVIDNDPGPHRD